MGMLVTEKSPIVNKLVTESGLMAEDHLRLVHIERNGAVISQPGLQHTTIRADDVLYFAGAVPGHVALACNHDTCSHTSAAALHGRKEA